MVGVGGTVGLITTVLVGVGAVVIAGGEFDQEGSEPRQTRVGVHTGAARLRGGFVLLVGNWVCGMLSDRTPGRLAAWGRRRPYILFGTLVNVLGLIWMAASHDIPTLTFAYVLVQFSRSAAQAPFHALLPDIVPEGQRGLVSGVMGLLAITGSIGGVIVAGLFVAASRPLPEYQRGLWLTYGIIIAVLVLLMLVTLISVRERMGASAQVATQEAEKSAGAPVQDATLEQPRRLSWVQKIPRSIKINVLSTLVVAVVVWGMMALWKGLHSSGLQISSEFQQVILEVVITIGLLRLFDFNPRRDPDFALVLLTRLVMMLGIFTIQAYLQYYLHDVVGASNPEQQATNFVIIVALTSLISAPAAGWLSDHFGRKRILYFSGRFIALVGLVFVIAHSLGFALVPGAIFSLYYAPIP